MGFDFDTVIDRSGGDSYKWNKYAGRDILPLWVADMDFAAPPAVIEALHRRVDHGVFGYGGPWPSLVDAVLEHLEREYGWAIEPAWIVWLPGLVTGLNVACRAVDGPVFTATPIYPPFLSSPRLSGRELATVPLAQAGAHWGWDFAATEAALAESRAKLWLLCHPHNPVGRAWSDEELARIAALAEAHDLVVCSDEIHCDLMLEGRHRPFATISPQAAARSITLMAPSKTFNVPGLGCAFAVIPDAGLRRSFRRAMDGIVPHINILGLVACEAALRHGGEWRAAMIDYLRGNRERVMRAVAEMPGLGMAPVEATYLAWIETTGIAHPARFFEQAGVGLPDGSDFGPGDAYARFVRLNFGCPRTILDRALERMAQALGDL
ncbi:MAG: putative C-S lyase [Rhodocyclales bacterium]|nr:putative C-S lyase [Rhodocyclales bacterium]